MVTVSAMMMILYANYLFEYSRKTLQYGFCCWIQIQAGYCQHFFEGVGKITIFYGDRFIVCFGKPWGNVPTCCNVESLDTRENIPVTPVRKENQRVSRVDYGEIRAITSSLLSVGPDGLISDWISGVLYQRSFSRWVNTTLGLVKWKHCVAFLGLGRRLKHRQTVRYLWQIHPLMSWCF